MTIDAGSVARFAALMADRTRAAICLALLDGRAWTAGELARHTGVGAPTASEHLSRMVEGGLLAEVRQGRHRYVRLRDRQTAQLVEDLGLLAGAEEAPRRSLAGVRASRALAAARTCYDHLAGRLGTGMFAALCDRGLLGDADGTALTPQGRAWFAGLGCVLPEPDAGRRPLVRACLDWTDRRPHLAGAAGAELRRLCAEREWIAPGARPREIRVTDRGRHAFADLLGLDTAAPAEPEAPRTIRARRDTNAAASRG
ncbi:ArsR family transcriptional regulator [Murinocardiopsis flavida]|uniref:ArsR family transcriptional regulator n=1 Tax=Murinocardiopsis flavida TaxID=645275 RepID=A0A2P8DU15_9ACTN|nr:winged helix-turn-helix domain-containing protein [Murinocardiopsis flavida]PSL00716.1 ArsR family transcriptional regulator [Murinocardiopsis flavida]